MKRVLVTIFLFILSITASSQTKMFISKASGTDSVWLSDVKSIYFKTNNSAQLLAWWPLDEGTGQKASDISGNGSSGQLSTGVTWVTGGLNLNGGSNSVDFADSAFQLAEGSWQAVINAASGQQGIILSKDNTGFQDDGILYLLADGKTSFVIHSKSTGTAIGITSSAAISYNVDDTITAEWGSKGMKLFVNDSLIGTNVYTGPILSPGRPLSLGEETASPSFNGIIKDVKVYRSYVK